MFTRPCPERLQDAVARQAPTSAAARGRLASFLDDVDTAAVRWSGNVGVVLASLLPANAALAAAGVAIGHFLFDDPALYFRELMPGTLLSAAHILAAALVALSIQRRDRRARRWHESFWGLSAVLLVLLTIVELAQPTVFISHWLRDDLGLRAPAGFADLDAVLLIFLLTGVAAILGARALDLLRYPRAVGLFACAALLGATSQFIDASFRVSVWEFVVEDSVKALAGPFLLAGYLAALGSLVRTQRDL